MQEILFTSYELFGRVGLRLLVCYITVKGPNLAAKDQIQLIFSDNAAYNKGMSHRDRRLRQLNVPDFSKFASFVG